MTKPDTSTFREAVAGVLGGCRPDAREVWRALGREGLLAGVYQAPGRVGLEADPGRLGALLVELDARFPVGVVLSVCVQVATAIPLLAEAASEATGAGAGLSTKVLDAALRGEAVLALAVTDSGAAGSDLLDARTEVRINADGLVVEGDKDWITNALHCDYALVLGRHREPRHFTSFCWVLVPATAPGVAAVDLAGDLFVGSGVGRLRFDRVALDADHLVGRPGRALAAFARQVATERLAGALWARALCRRVLVDTRRWLAHRPLHGRTLWDNAAVRERFARCLVELARLDALAAGYADGPGLTAARGMVLKAATGDSVDRILGECVNLRGADAFRAGGLAGLRAEAALFGIAGGATGALLAGVASHADELLGGP